MTLIIITIGASIFLRGVAAIVFDKNFHSLSAVRRDRAVRFGGATILPQSVIVLVGAGVIVVALWAVHDRARLLGKAMVATAANRLAARLVGINTAAIVGLSFAVSAAIGAIGGILVTPITLTNYDVGTLLALKGFAAAMLGGMGNPLGAVVGGLDRRPAGDVRRRLHLVGLQGRDRVPRHSRRAVRDAAGPVRPRRDRARLMAPADVRGMRCSPARYGAVVADRGVRLRPCRCVSLPSPFYLRIAALVFIFALAVLGLNLLMGFAGQVSLGHAGFFGIGAYAVAVGADASRRAVLGSR